MSFYFRNTSNFDYKSPLKGAASSDTIQVKNLFRRNKIRDDIFGNLVYFTKYNIVGNERPDQIAEKFYDDETLDWVILLSNNILDVRSEWPLDNLSFQEALYEKYKTDENIYSIHHYETIEIKNSLGVSVLKPGLIVGKDWRTNGNFISTNSQRISQIFSGDAINPTTTITVTLSEPLKNLKVGNLVTISNVTEAEYNGDFKVESILDPFGNGNIESFTYKLATVPEISLPAITLDNSERAKITIYDDSVTGNGYQFEYYDKGILTKVNSAAFIKGVTNYDYELNINNKKREIFVLKPNYLGIVLNDMENIGS